MLTIFFCSPWVGLASSLNFELFRSGEFQGHLGGFFFISWWVSAPRGGFVAGIDLKLGKKAGGVLGFRLINTVVGIREVDSL